MEEGERERESFIRMRCIFFTRSLLHSIQMEEFHPAREDAADVE